MKASPERVKAAKRAFTSAAAEAELRRLVNLVADVNGFSPEDRALECYRALAAEELPDPRAEDRRQRVLDMLAEHPTARYALVTDTGADPEAVLLTMVIRDQASFELRIPRAKYDGLLLLDLIERHGATVH
jgi:hypothetical protein